MSIPAYRCRFPGQIVFGWGCRTELPALAARLGRRALLVSGSQTLERQGILAELSRALSDAGIDVQPLVTISREPRCDDVDAAAAHAREILAETASFAHSSAPLTAGGSNPSGTMILAVGGGAALDMGKAIAALATQAPASIVDYLEGVGRGLTPSAPPLPVIAVPTTAGTGSEATKNAVISSDNPPFKKSLRDDRLFPAVALVDPQLTVSAPATVTAHSGLDAITQLIESYLSCRGNVLTRGLVESILPAALEALPQALADGQLAEPREVMSQAALLSGLALANSGLGLAHAVAAALGCVGDVAHGLACAVMLPSALQFNRHVCAAPLARLERLCALRSGEPVPRDDASAADAFLARVEQLVGACAIPRRLRDLRVSHNDIPALVAGSHGNSLSGNPRPVGDDELSQLLEALW